MTPIATQTPSLRAAQREMTLLNVDELHVRYPGSPERGALRDVSFRISPGEFVAVIGRSGAGKSSLLHALGGVLMPESGAIQWNHLQSVAQACPPRWASLPVRTALLFQNHRLVPPLSALTNVCSGSLGEQPWTKTLFGFSADTKTRAERWLTAVGLRDKLHSPARKLSGGEQQRVAIARALMQEPRVLLADEPVASLDAETANEIMLLLQSLNQKQGATILCVLHDLEMVERFASRALLLDRGELVYDGCPRGIQEIVREKLSWKTL